MSTMSTLPRSSSMQYRSIGNERYDASCRSIELVVREGYVETECKPA